MRSENGKVNLDPPPVLRADTRPPARSPTLDLTFSVKAPRRIGLHSKTLPTPVFRTRKSRPDSYPILHAVGYASGWARLGLDCRRL